MSAWSISHPTARKAHWCDMCARVIDPGEKYLRGSGFGDGTAWTWKECAHCEAARKLYDVEGDEGEYSADAFHEWSRYAHDLIELRHAAGYRMKWRTRMGTLLPVPKPSGYGSTEGEHP